MRAVAAVASALLLSGCITSRGEWEVRPWSPDLAAELPFDDVEFVLTDGRVERLKDVGDHGYAICGSNETPGCVRKADIVTVAYRSEYKDPSATAIAVPIAAVPVAVLGLICLTNCNFNGTPYEPTGKEPVATQQQIERQWLDGLRIENGRTMPYNPLGENACVGDKPTAVGRDFATDVEALAWIVANRNQVSKECLDRVFYGGRAASAADGPENERLGMMQVAAVTQVRSKWNIDRCVITTRNDYLKRQSNARLAPQNMFTFGDRRGSPDALRILEETLNDPATYAYEGDLPRVCTEGILPKEQWPDLPEWIAAHSPFAAAP